MQLLADLITIIPALYHKLIAIILLILLLLLGKYAWARIVPVIDDVKKEWLGFRKESKELHEILRNYSVATMSMSSTIAAMEKRYRHTRNEILIVDDDPTSICVASAAISSAKVKLPKYKHATLSYAASLGEIYAHLYDSMVIILDVMLPDASLADIKIFVHNCRECPVIIYSANTYTPEDFPEAFAIVKKGSGIIHLSLAIENALVSLRAGQVTGCDKA